MHPEYDFSKGVRGKYFERYQSGPVTVVVKRADSANQSPSRLMGEPPSADGSATVIEQIADAIRNRTCVIFGGAGLSVDAGLPTWPGMARQLVSSLSDNHKLDPRITSKVEDLLSIDLLAPALALLFSCVQRGVAAQALRPILEPTGASRTHEAIKRLRPRGFVTTNYDRLSETALSPTCYRLTNSRSDLKLVPTAVQADTQFLLKIHGDMDNALEPGDAVVADGAPFMVLAPTDYAVLRQGERGKAITLAFHSILQESALLFLGYSFSDPDITWVLQFLTESCQFAHTSWYVARRGDPVPQLPANVHSVLAVDRWEDLPDWLAEVGRRAAASPPTAPLVTTPQKVGPSEKDRSAYLSVSRFLSDMESDSLPERVLGSVLIGEWEPGASVPTDALTARVADLLETGPQLANALAKAAASYLVSKGLWETGPSDTYRVNAQATEILRRDVFEAWDRDRKAFYSSAQARLGLLAPLDAGFTDTLDRLLQDLCITFGQRLAQWVIRGLSNELEWTETAEAIRNAFPPGNDARRVEALLKLVFQRPTATETPYLYRLLGAAFLANSVRLDPAAAGALQLALAAYELYVDSNILLPLVIREHQRHHEVRTIVDESRRAGSRLYVIRELFNELLAHRTVAEGIAKDYHEDSSQLREVVDVFGQRANCFIQGFVNECERATRSTADGGPHKMTTWRQYMSRYTATALETLLRDRGVSIVDAEEPTDSDYRGVLDEITLAWQRRTPGGTRASVLNENEARQFLQIYLRREASERHSTWFLSHETVFIEVFRRAPQRWKLPPTIPFPAWVALLDSKLPWASKRPQQIVAAILKSYAASFDLPDTAELVRRKAFGERVTTKEEEDALQLVLTDFQLASRIEAARRGVASRWHRREARGDFESAEALAVGEISTVMAEQIRRLREELEHQRAGRREAEAKLGIQQAETSAVRQPGRGRYRRR